MAAIKKSVRLVDKTIRICNNLTEHSGDVNWSGSINAMAEQYELLINDNLPTFTENQWNAFYCAFNGYAKHPDPKTEADLLHWHISEGYQYDQQIRDFLGSESDAMTFIEMIKLMSTSQRLAVIYKARSYWRSRPITDLESEE